MRRITGLTLAVIIALAVTGEQVATRQFRGGTALVLVDVVATQRDGNLARDLKREDFEILEDGKPQQVRQFQVVDLEVAAQQAADPPGVFSNRSEPGGIFALVLDEMMVDPRHGGRMQDWARRFIDEQVRPGDYVGVMRSGADSPLLLTTDRDLLRPIIADATGRKDINDLKSLTGTNVSGDTISPPSGDATQSMPDFSALGLLDASPATRIAAEQSMVMLQRVVEYLAPIPARRKAVLLFSQGVAFDLEAFSDNSNSRSFEGMRRLLTAAREGNVAVYTLDPRGLQGALEPDIQEKAVGNPIDRGVDTLRDLAAATGGRAIVSRNDLAGALDRISRENRFYYLIGYEPTDTNPRSRAKRIEVRTRAAGVSLLHRRSYSPPAANAKNAPVVVSPLPVSDLAITLAPVVFPDPAGGASLAVPFELGAGLAGTPRVNYRLVAIDGRGRQSGLMTGTVQATSGSAKGMVRQQLAPGRYQLRLQADIPDGASGVALANVEMIAPNAAAPTCGGFMLLQADFNGPPRPNVSRRLRANQSVMAAMVLSARDLANTTLALVATRKGGADAEIPVGTPQSIGAGLWRVETAIPASTFAGDVELTLLADEKPVTNCRAEVRFE
jgi:VWFA-related protein